MMISPKLSFTLILAIVAGLSAQTFKDPWYVKKNPTEPSKKLWNVSGMALVTESADETVFLAVHDNNTEPIVAILTIPRQGNTIGYSRLEWPGSDPPPIDLEAITRVPCQAPSKVDCKELFLALNSDGKIYGLRLVPQNEKDPKWRLEFNQDKQPVEKVPGILENLEGFDLQLVGGVPVAVWSDRGFARNLDIPEPGDRPATLYAQQFNLTNFTLEGTPKKWTVPAVYPRTSVRAISDLRVDRNGKVVASAAHDDDNDEGPFSSAVSEIGRITIKNGVIDFTLNQGKPRLFERNKIEAIEFSSYAEGELVFGTDDENHGAKVYFEWKKLPKN